MVLSIVPIQVDGLWLALPANAVQEILGKRPWISIAGAPPELPGVLAWRGRAIAVFDVGRVVDGAEPMSADETRDRIVVVQHNACTMALPVDAVREVQDVPEDGVHAAQQTRQRFSEHEIDLNGTPVPLIDIDALIQSIAPPGEAA
jgi:chemotaxis signal transduction protein